MKLQIKDSGAWRNLTAIPDERQAQAMNAAARLLSTLGDMKTAMRVTEGNVALYHCQAPDFQWTLASGQSPHNVTCSACQNTRKCCAMNCGPCAGDKRTRTDVMRDCDDCDACYACLRLVRNKAGIEPRAERGIENV